MQIVVMYNLQLIMIENSDGSLWNEYLESAQLCKSII